MPTTSVDQGYYHRTTCRLCDSSDVSIAVHLKPTAIADAYVPADRTQETKKLYPLDLYLCNRCGHAQLLDVISPETLFRNYIYVSSSSLRLDEHFEAYAKSVCDKLKIRAGSRCVDIGSNDGMLLRCLLKRDIKILGVDPAKRIAAMATASGVPTLPLFFGREVGKKIRSEYGAADLITANNVFAHMDDLGDFADGVRELLAPDGYFVFEVSNLLDLMRGMVFDFVYHEHLSSHSVKPLVLFLKKHGLDLVDVERVATKGGSIRGFAQLATPGRKIQESVGQFLQEEKDAKLDTLTPFREFEQRIAREKETLLQHLKGLRATGRTIGGYGASATSTTLIYEFDLAPYLDFIVDDNPDRQGLFSPGYDIPIVSAKEIAKKNPAGIVVLAWRYVEPILKNTSDYLRSGGQLVIPLPKFRVIKTVP